MPLLISSIDSDMLEPVDLLTLKENRQYVKLLSKVNREFESLQRKHEKVTNSLFTVFTFQLR